MLGVICMMVGLIAALSILMTSSVMTKARAAFYRETASHTYSSSLFPLAYLLTEVFLLAIVSIAVRCLTATRSCTQPCV